MSAFLAFFPNEIIFLGRTDKIGQMYATFCCAKFFVGILHFCTSREQKHKLPLFYIIFTLMLV